MGTQLCLRLFTIKQQYLNRYTKSAFKLCRYQRDGNSIKVILWRKTYGEYESFQPSKRV